MAWTNIVSYISYKQISECLGIETDTQYVSEGALTEEGVRCVFEEVSDYCDKYRRAKKTEISEELRVKKENEIIQNFLDAYIYPEAVVRKVNWISKFQFINDYTLVGSRFPFLGAHETGNALIWFEMSGGFMLTLLPPIMTFINDMHYQEESTLPEFNFDDVTSTDVFLALEQAIILKICEIEKEAEEFIC